MGGEQKMLPKTKPLGSSCNPLFSFQRRQWAPSGERLCYKGWANNANEPANQVEIGQRVDSSCARNWPLWPGHRRAKHQWSPYWVAFEWPTNGFQSNKNQGWCAPKWNQRQGLTKVLFLTYNQLILGYLGRGACKGATEVWWITISDYSVKHVSYHHMYKVCCFSRYAACESLKLYCFIAHSSCC